MKSHCIFSYLYKICLKHVICPKTCDIVLLIVPLKVEYITPNNSSTCSFKVTYLYSYDKLFQAILSHNKERIRKRELSFHIWAYLHFS